MNRPTASTITDEQLDYITDLKDRSLRALDRAHALVEEWQGDQTSTTRAEAAVLLAEVLQLHGWTQSDARPALAAVSPVAALEAPGPRRPAAGRSGGDGAGFNGPGKPSSRVGDSRPDPSEAENALRGGSPGPAASDGPGPASSPRTPATATSHPIDQETP